MKASLTIIAMVCVTGAASASPIEARRAQCIGWMVQGYPSGIEETACTAQFSLPSPFLFKCARAQRVGFESEMQRNACRSFFEEAFMATDQGYVRRN